MSEVLFVCRANAIRSKMAAAYYNHFTGTRGAESAGVRPKESTRFMRRDVREFLAGEGIHMSAWEARPRKLSSRMVQQAGKVVLLTTKDIPDLVDVHPLVEEWDVGSPRTKDGLFLTSELIKRYIMEDITIAAPELERP